MAEALRSSAALPEAKRPEVIPGIEFSTEYLGSDIHIVGLDMQYQAPEFQATVASFRDDRLIRNKKMIARMAADHIDISYEEMAKATANRYGPVHILPDIWSHTDMSLPERKRLHL